MLIHTKALRDAGQPSPDIARKLVIATGKNKGKNPSVASLYGSLSADSPVLIAPSPRSALRLLTHQLMIFSESGYQPVRPPPVGPTRVRGPSLV